MDKKLETYFFKYLKGEYDFHGIKLIPNLNDYDSTINWSISNPNNLSYSISALKDLPDEKLKLFSDLMDDRDFYLKNYNRLCKFEKNDRHYYINKQDESELNKGLEKINEINFKEFHCEVYPYWFEIDVNGEEVTITIEMRFMDCMNVKTGEKIIGKNLSKMYKKMVQDDDFYNNYEYILFNPLIKPLWDMPTFTNPDYFYFSPNIIPFDKNGKKLELI